MSTENGNESSSKDTEVKIDYRMPIYLQLREIVRSKIEEGEYMPGTAIPSENKLAETFDINRLTVRNAVDALVNEGILHRVQGKGVFVVGQKYEKALEEYGGFVNNVYGGGKHVTIKELTKALRPAGNKFANYFDMEPDEPLFYVKQLSAIGDEPISLEEIYVPQKILPELEVVNSTVFSMKDIFAFYGIELYSMRQTLEVVNGMTKTRKMLNMPSGVALMRLSVDYFDKTGQVIEYSTSLVRSDRCSFNIKTS